MLLTLDLKTDPILIDRHALRHIGGNIYLDFNSSIVCWQQLFFDAECWVFGFAMCMVCTESKCRNCSTEMYMQDNSCFCYEGEPLGEFCNTIPGCISLINVQGGTACLLQHQRLLALLLRLPGNRYWTLPQLCREEGGGEQRHICLCLAPASLLPI